LLASKGFFQKGEENLLLAINIPDKTL